MPPEIQNCTRARPGPASTSARLARMFLGRRRDGEGPARAGSKLKRARARSRTTSPCRPLLRAVRAYAGASSGASCTVWFPRKTCDGSGRTAATRSPRARPRTRDVRSHCTSTTAAGREARPPTALRLNLGRPLVERGKGGAAAPRWARRRVARTVSAARARQALVRRRRARAVIGNSGTHTAPARATNDRAAAPASRAPTSSKAGSSAARSTTRRGGESPGARVRRERVTPSSPRATRSGTPRPAAAACRGYKDAVAIRLPAALHSRLPGDTTWRERAVATLSWYD